MNKMETMNNSINKLIQLPDSPTSDLDGINAICTMGADYHMNQFVMVDDIASGRQYFAQIAGPQRNLNRTGLGEFDQSTITALESIEKGDYNRDSRVREIFLYVVRLLREIKDGSVEVITRRPQSASLARPATADEVIQFLGLPIANPKTIVGRITGTEIGVHFDAKRFVYHTLIAGATGSGKSNAGANIVASAVNTGFCPIVYDHKPDFQDMHKPNLEGDDSNCQPQKVNYWYLGAHKNANGNNILVPASAFSPNMLAATIFWADSEMQQREECEHALEIFNEERIADGKPTWTLNEFYWWLTRGKGNAVVPAEVEQILGHKPDARTLQAFLRKICRRNRKPSWVDGADVSAPLTGGPAVGSMMGRAGASFQTPRWFDPVSVIEPGHVLCIKVNGSEAGREYALFLDFMLKQVERARADKSLVHPVLHFIDEAQDIFSGSKRFADAVGALLSTMIRKGRSLNIAFAISVQSADQVPEDIRNNLNTRIIMRHNNAACARASLEKATPEQIAQTAHFGPGQALVDIFGSNAVVQAQMLRSPFALTVENFDEADAEFEV